MLIAYVTHPHMLRASLFASILNPLRILFKADTAVTSLSQAPRRLATHPHLKGLPTMSPITPRSPGTSQARSDTSRSQPVSLIVPTVIESGARGERAYDLFSRLLRERIVLINGPVEDQLANLI